MELVNTYLDMGGMQEASRQVDLMLANAKSPGRKVDILYHMAEVCQDRQDLETALAYLRRVPEVVSYDEVKRAMEADIKARKRMKEMEKLLDEI